VRAQASVPSSLCLKFSAREYLRVTYDWFWVKKEQQHSFTLTYFCIFHLILLRCARALTSVVSTSVDVQELWPL
jgi:hypothetical protein